MPIIDNKIDAADNKAFIPFIAILLTVLLIAVSGADVYALPHAPASVTISGTDKAASQAQPVLLVAATDQQPAAAQKSPTEPEKDEFDEMDKNAVADPIEPVNRLMFGFNDRLYFWVMKPFYSVYNTALPEGVRIAGRNFFDNIAMPVRFVSCLVQIRIQCSAVEIARFGINSTVGVVGLFDVAAGEKINLKPQDADMGLAFGHYGIKEGFYLVIPFMGPSSLRDGVGTVADSFLTPTTYIPPWYVPYAISAVNYLNRGSLSGKDYEELIKASIDPYTAIKDGYTQYRRGKIK